MRACKAEGVAGERTRRALQLWRWMYSDGRWIKHVGGTSALQNGFSSSFV